MKNKRYYLGSKSLIMFYGLYVFYELNYMSYR